MKRVKNLLRAASVFALMGSLVACGNLASNGTAQSVNGATTPSATSPAGYVMNSFTWDIYGTTQLNFTVVPAGANFTVTINTYQNQQVGKIVTISSTTSALGYQMLQNVFSGLDGFVATNNYSGTYSSITEVDRNGATQGTLQFPTLYSGNVNGLTAFFQYLGTQL